MTRVATSTDLAAASTRRAPSGSVATAPAIACTGVSVRFGDFASLSDVSLDVPTGSTLALIGPNGAGKTTFLDARSGRFALTAGCVMLQGRDITAEPTATRALRGLPGDRCPDYACRVGDAGVAPKEAQQAVNVIALRGDDDLDFMIEKLGRSALIFGCPRSRARHARLPGPDSSEPGRFGSVEPRPCAWGTGGWLR